MSPVEKPYPKKNLRRSRYDELINEFREGALEEDISEDEFGRPFSFERRPERDMLPFFRPEPNLELHTTKIPPKKTFRINELIELKLMDRQTMIYINGRPFSQCKYLFLLNPQEKTQQDEIDSIDEAAEVLSSDLERDIQPEEIGLTPEEEFVGHCSNIQAWVENGYDTRLLHSNLAFPLLKRLADEGDLKAQRAFQNQIVDRLSSGFKNTVIYLLKEGYTDFLRGEQIELLFDSPNSRFQEIFFELLETAPELGSALSYVFFNLDNGFMKKFLPLLTSNQAYHLLLYYERVDSKSPAHRHAIEKLMLRKCMEDDSFEMLTDLFNIRFLEKLQNSQLVELFEEKFSLYAAVLPEILQEGFYIPPYETFSLFGRLGRDGITYFIKIIPYIELSEETFFSRLIDIFIEFLSHHEFVSYLNNKGYYIIDYFINQLEVKFDQHGDLEMDRIFEKLFPFERRIFECGVFHNQIESYFSEKGLSYLYDLKFQSIHLFLKQKNHRYYTEYIESNGFRKVCDLIKEIFFPEERLSVMNVDRNRDFYEISVVNNWWREIEQIYKERFYDLNNQQKIKDLDLNAFRLQLNEIPHLELEVVDQFKLLYRIYRKLISLKPHTEGIEARYIPKQEFLSEMRRFYKNKGLKMKIQYFPRDILIRTVTLHPLDTLDTPYKILAYEWQEEKEYDVLRNCRFFQDITSIFFKKEKVQILKFRMANDESYVRIKVRKEFQFS